MSKIKLTNYEKSYNGRAVLKGVSLVVKAGEFLAILGPSGSGKTTLLRGIMEEVPGGIMVYQDDRLFPHFTVEENVGFGLKVSRNPRYKKSEIEKKVNNMLKLVGLEGMNEKYPRELSGGERKRVAYGRGLAVEPEILLLDEPFSGLDTNLRGSMRDLTLQLHKKLRMTTVLVTHDIEEALMLSDRIAILIDGEIQQVGPPMEVLNGSIYKRRLNGKK